MNTQYSPWDECEASPSNIEPLFPGINQRMFIDVAVARPDTVAVDHFPDWLGHGVRANDSTCPHCGEDNTRWISADGIHPNAAGYEQMALKWELALERMLAPACGAR